MEKSVREHTKENWISALLASTFVLPYYAKDYTLQVATLPTLEAFNDPYNEAAHENPPLVVQLTVCSHLLIKPLTKNRKL